MSGLDKAPHGADSRARMNWERFALRGTGVGPLLALTLLAAVFLSGVYLGTILTRAYYETRDTMAEVARTCPTSAGVVGLMQCLREHGG